MRLLISISLILLLAWQGLFKAGFILYWKVNQTYISQKLCENKDKPKMHCNGKCYLGKQLNKVEEEKKNQKDIPFTILKLKSLDNFIFQGNECRLIAKIFFQKQNSFFRYSQIVLPGYRSYPFRPPDFS